MLSQQLPGSDARKLKRREGRREEKGKHEKRGKWERELKGREENKTSRGIWTKK